VGQEVLREDADTDSDFGACPIEQRKRAFGSLRKIAADRGLERSDAERISLHGERL